MRSPKSRGFSLFELVILIAVGAILLTIAVPQFQRSIAATRLQGSAAQIETDLHLARRIAVTQNSVVQIQLDLPGRSFQILAATDSSNEPRAVKHLDPGVFFASVPQTPLVFLPQGGAQGGTIQLADEFGKALKILISDTGEVQVVEAVESADKG